MDLEASKDNSSSDETDDPRRPICLTLPFSGQAQGPKCQMRRRGGGKCQKARASCCAQLSALRSSSAAHQQMATGMALRRILTQLPTRTCQYVSWVACLDRSSVGRFLTAAANTRILFPGATTSSMSTCPCGARTASLAMRATLALPRAAWLSAALTR